MDALKFTRDGKKKKKKNLIVEKKKKKKRGSLFYIILESASSFLQTWRKQTYAMPLNEESILVCRMTRNHMVNKNSAFFLDLRFFLSSERFFFIPRVISAQT